MLVVGLTGGIGSGKSSVAAFLAGKGARVVDADGIGRALLRTDGAARDAVLARFGRGVLGADGEIDRKRLAGRVFGDEAGVRDLNAITHPRIREAIAREIDRAREDGVRVLVLEAALLVEAGATDLVDLLVVVEAPREVRIARLLARGGWTREDIEGRMAAQAPEETLRREADFVVENDRDPETLGVKAALLWERIAARAGADGGGA
jgi:dephospho-CoA kinase